MQKALNVKAIREALNWTQVQLGAAVGVDQSTVSNWENGKHPKGPARMLLEKLVEERAE